MITMVQLSELRTEAEIHERDMHDVDYRREVERTQFANDVAIKVIHYRVSRGMSQAELARMTGRRQPNVARLESGEHEPSLSTATLHQRPTGPPMAAATAVLLMARPQLSSDPVLVTACEDAIPVASRVTWPTLTSTGSRRSVVVPSPTCPCVLCPHPNTDPLSERTST
jgi:transcriptional regulator with XRE-family HTH domain